MRAIDQKIEGDLALDDEVDLRGMVDGNLTISAGASVSLHGMCTGNVVVEEGGVLNLHGMVLGDVINAGGDLDVRGMIRGILRERSGSTSVDAGAVIGGRES